MKNDQFQQKTKEVIKPDVRKLKVNLSSNFTLKGSKIIDGYKGKFFQDEFKNLWAMGKDSKLQVLKKDPNKEGYLDSGWTDGDLGLTKGSKINNGEGGTIFQDKFKNLWVLGKSQKLQVLKSKPNGSGYLNIGWINDNNENTGDELLKNSNIADGQHGTIFQDSFGNLWTMGKNQKLQVLKVNGDDNGYVNLGWINDNNENTGDNLLKNSNIANGQNGKFFQDEFKNLWAIGRNQKLQVLKSNENGNGYVEEGWINDNNKTTGDNLLKNSNIANGQNGTIFQDKFKNLWTMGKESKLQVLRVNRDSNGYVEEGWINDNSLSGNNLLKNSNIIDGNDGIIFQDKFKNLWIMGKNQKLQVLKVNGDDNGYVEEGWINDNNKTTGDNLLKNSNIANGQNGKIFQDSFGNLWTMGKISKLQVLKVNQNGNGYVNTGWTNDNDKNTGDNLLKNSNIDKGRHGKIFQDFFGNLWAMGKNQKLQVLKANEDGNGYVESWES